MLRIKIFGKSSQDCWCGVIFVSKSKAKPAKRSKGLYVFHSERSKANWSTTVVRSEANRTGLIFAALNGVKGGGVKKKKLFERSEFFFFSSTLSWSSGEYAALTFCFFSVKGKEKS